MAGTLGVTSNTFAFDDIIAEPGARIVRRTILANAGAARAAGTVLGRITASGKLDQYVAGHMDGTEVASAILLEDVAASASDSVVLVGYAGVYRDAALTGIDAAGRLLLEARGIYTDAKI
jgi:hypothetical protein